MNNKMNILIADDESDTRDILNEILTEDGYNVFLAEDGKSTKKMLNMEIDLLLLDIKFGVDDGIEVLKEVKIINSLLPVIMITGHGSVSLAKQAFKFGAHDFLEKPLGLTQVRTSVRNALEGLSLKRKLLEKTISVATKPIFTSSVMQDLFYKVKQLASIKESITITGESGTGKELVARGLHYEGSRAHFPFIVSNAASMPISLAESELFGSEKGAFTGSDKLRIGKIEEADNGSLFLDEIADMDLQIQAKLLRVLEYGTFTRLGSNKEIKVNIRIICATHKNMEELVSLGSFRQDLWYRINAFTLRVPSLDKRKDDIPLLVNHFAKIISADIGVEKTFPKDTIDEICKMTFLGNVRELKHTIAKLAVFSVSNTVTVEEVQILIKEHNSLNSTRSFANASCFEQKDFKKAKDTFEKEFITNALARNNDNITSTASEIGMAQSNLSRKLKELGLR